MNNSDRQRLILFFLLAIALTSGTQALLGALGLLPPPAKPNPKPQPQVAQVEKPSDQAANKGPADAPAPIPGRADADAEAAAKPEAAPVKRDNQPVAMVDASQLVLGSTEVADGYHLAVRLTQTGAGVSSVALSRFNAEYNEGQSPDRPLQLLVTERNTPPSFIMGLDSPRGPARPDAAALGEDAGPAMKVGSRLDFETWEVVRDDAGRVVRPVTKTDQATKAQVAGQEVVFRTVEGDPPLVITKRYRLWKGQDGFELDLGFESPSGDRTLAYRLAGPHGIPIEGEWYTYTFRDVFFGQHNRDIVSRDSSEVVKKEVDQVPLSEAALLYTGVENQYFATFLQPVPQPTTKEEDRIAETISTVIRDDPQNHQLADVSVEVKSKEFQVGPNRPVTHAYRVYAGPKRAVDLAPYGAEELATYRKSWFPVIGPLATVVAKFAITPLLDRIYALTQQVSGFFGGKRGNFGIAIILLTITVRLILFPMSRKQALSAKKMQDLQPLMAELKEKYKDDKERMTKETFALYKKHGVNPVGGCLPALIQLPIFIGLWQALNNSVALRQAPFLWIDNLAAPDMLFKFPMAIPFLGEYFNLLPFLVVALMLVQTKLFSPPPTTPEAEMQQKMMKYMMIFMAFMFYKVPSGLGIYFITSSLWAISERLLLPKVTHAHAADPKGNDGPSGPSGGGGPGRGGPGGGGKDGNGGDGPPGGWWSQHRQRLERLMEEASKDRTVRNDEGRDRDRDRGRDGGKDKDRPKVRPGKRR